MNAILVIDTAESTCLEFFIEEFSRNRLDLRITTNIEEAKQHYNSTQFGHIFVGDIEDINWMNTSKMHDKNIYAVILYSINPTMIATQLLQIPTAFCVPFYSLPTFIDEEQIKVIFKEEV